MVYLIVTGFYNQFRKVAKRPTVGEEPDGPCPRHHPQPLLPLSHSRNDRTSFPRLYSFPLRTINIQDHAPWALGGACGKWNLRSFGSFEGCEICVRVCVCVCCTHSQYRPCGQPKDAHHLADSFGRLQRTPSAILSQFRQHLILGFLLAISLFFKRCVFSAMSMTVFQWFCWAKAFFRHLSLSRARFCHPN